MNTTASYRLNTRVRVSELSTRVSGHAHGRFGVVVLLCADSRARPRTPSLLCSFSVKPQKSERGRGFLF